MKIRNTFLLLALIFSVNLLAQSEEPYVPENNSHPSFAGCRISPDSIKFYPQNPNDVVSFVYETKQSPNTVFNNAKQWVAKNFKEYKDVVQMEDMNNHTLVFKGNIRQKKYRNSKCSYYTILFFTATIECKTNRFRIKMEDFSVKEIGDVVGYPTTLTMNFRELQEKINSPLVTSIEYKIFLKHVIEDSKENTALFFNSLSSAMNTVDDF